MYKYRDPFRPIYEWWAIGAWLLSAVCFSLVALEKQSIAFLMPALLAVLMIARRGVTAHGLLRIRNHLQGIPLTFMKMTELAKKMAARKSKHIWFGYGFDWTQDHAQKVFQLGLRTPEALVAPDDERLGHPWIHGLGKAEEQDIYVPIKHTEGHTLIIGTTGAGKTRAFEVLIAQAVRRKETVFVYDPKGDKDLQGVCRREAERAGADFIAFDPAQPQISDRLDPMKNWNRPTELASRIAALLASEDGFDAFTGFSWMVLNAIASACILVYRKPSLANLLHYVQNGADQLVIETIRTHLTVAHPTWNEEIDTFMSAFQGRKNKANEAAAHVACYQHIVADRPKVLSPIVGQLISMYEHDRSHFSKMVTSLMPLMVMLTSGSLGGLLSPDMTDLSDMRDSWDSGRIIKAGAVAYIALDSLGDKMVAGAIGSMLLADLTSVAGDRYNYGVDDQKINVFIDEAAEIVNDPFVQLLNKGRGAGFTATIATQTLADFTVRLGSPAQTQMTLGNINNWLALRANSKETAEELAAVFPNVHIRKIDYTQGTSQGSDNPGKFTGSASERMSTEEVPAIDARMLRCLGTLEFFAQTSGGRVRKGRLPILQE